MITIEINGHRHEVHHREMTGRQIKALGHHEHGTLFRIEGEGRHRVGDDDVVHLHADERFEIESGYQISIRIEVDGETIVVRHRTRTGAEIKALAHQPPGNVLYRLHSGQRIKIADDEIVHLHESERFITIPPVGQAA